jgi:tyrosyl-tRNA synthetase
LSRPLNFIREDGTVMLAALIAGIGYAPSDLEARRLIQGGGVELDGVRVSEPTAVFSANALRGRLLCVGKHRFARSR